MKKLLVANRGEIACRVFQACREMGIRTVAIYTEPDFLGRHVTFADEIALVPSYLDVDAIVSVAKERKVDLVHPGYGFLSEQSRFSKALEKAGISFVGPAGETMDLMGDKIQSKLFAEKSQVPTLPWAIIKKGESLTAKAQKVGFPLLLKASAGGGGKGMRLVHKESEVEAAAESAMAEAKSAFGDGTIFLERFVSNPRHIEVQVFGDGKGGGVHLHERDCSLQRRHQKVWEEAPASILDARQKASVAEAAMKLVEATKYRNAGTVEFLFDGEGFYFLEMNTRLQVEHPVSELVTGVDLVQWQIELAQGLPFKQSSPSVSGHSIEVRIYAEDASQGFLPTPGKVTELIWPTGNGIRVDSGIEVGQPVETHFDPMLAKLIVWAADRDSAMKRMNYAISETLISGLGTNLSYLKAIGRHPKVIGNEFHTGFLEKELKDFKMSPSDDTLSFLASVQPSIGAPTSQDISDVFPSPWYSVEGN